MKKLIIGIMCVTIVVLGCGCSETTEKAEDNIGVTEKGVGEALLSKHEENSETKPIETIRERGTKRMVMLKGKLYVDTGEIGSAPTCGVMDFSFDKTTNEVPTKNGQTNFGTGYEGQYYIRDNRIIIMIEDKPCVFAYQENDIQGVTMSVVSFTKKRAEICIKNLSKMEWDYDEKFELEHFDSKSGIWETVDTVSENVAFHEMIEIIEAGKTSNITVEWEWLYGKLEKGKYRIIKELYPALYLSVAQGAHIYTAEFEILK